MRAMTEKQMGGENTEGDTKFVYHECFGRRRKITAFRGKAAENHPYKNYPKLIVHASRDCQDDDCKVEGCPDMKKDYVHHYNTCHEFRFGKPCLKCEQTVVLSHPHAEECTAGGYCMVPWCDEIRHGFEVQKYREQQNLLESKENVEEQNT